MTRIEPAFKYCLDSHHAWRDGHGSHSEFLEDVDYFMQQLAELIDERVQAALEARQPDPP